MIQYSRLNIEKLRSVYMSYKMLVLDIDDTLLNSNHEISSVTKERLIQFQEDGFILVLATGRPTKSAVQKAEELLLDHHKSHAISFNGAVVTSMENAQELFSQRMNFDEQKELVQYIHDTGLALIAYGDNEVYLSRENDYSHIEGELTGLETIYDSDYANNLESEELKFIAVGDPEIVAKHNEELQGKFGKATNAATSKDYFLEFMHRDVSKGLSLQRLCDHIGIDISEVVAVGDGNNDAPMIEVAGVGVAMGNASEYLKGIADDVTGTNDEDGVVQVLDKYFY